MTNVAKLLNKYYKPDGKNLTGHIKVNKAEKHSPPYNTKLKKQKHLKHRHLILDILLNEIPFYLNPNQVTQIRYWIERFNDNFKNFNRRASNETIILAFIFIQYKQDNPKIEPYRYSVSKKYNLTQAKFTTIQNRLIFELMRTTELTYNQSKYYNHEYLTKNGAE